MSSPEGTKKQPLVIGSRRRGPMLLSDDLVLEILSRLPTKSLSRFRSVSKSWNAGIAHITSHRRLLLPISGFFFYKSVYHPAQESYLSIAPHADDNRPAFAPSRLAQFPFHSTSYVINSCNGLFLFTNEEFTHYVCNPVTMEFVALPPPENNKEADCFIAYDPRESPHYDVVRFVFNAKSPIAVEIYSSVTGRWATCSARHQDPPACRTGWHLMSVFHRGALHMLTYSAHLVRFDTKTRSFEQIMLPAKKVGSGIRFACIGESRGHLFYAVSFLLYELHIYMLEEWNSDKWLLTHEMSTEFLRNHNFSSGLAGLDPSFNFRPIAFHPDSEVIYISIPSKILSYHPSSGRLEEVCRFTDYRGTIDWVLVFPVIPCLESLNPPGEKFIDPFSLEDK